MLKHSEFEALDERVQDLAVRFVGDYLNERQLYFWVQMHGLDHAQVEAAIEYVRYAVKWWLLRALVWAGIFVGLLIIVLRQL